MYPRYVTCDEWNEYINNPSFHVSMVTDSIGQIHIQLDMKRTVCLLCGRNLQKQTRFTELHHMMICNITDMQAVIFILTNNFTNVSVIVISDCYIEKDVTKLAH